MIRFFVEPWEKWPRKETPSYDRNAADAAEVSVAAELLEKEAA